MEEMKITKTGTCSSLSGKSTLTYEMGIKDDKEVWLRLTENSGSGIFNKSWVALAEIENLLASEKKAVTSGSLHGLFEGKSANSSGFILAVLLKEGFVKVSKDNARHYERAEHEEWEKVIIGTSAPAKKKSVRESVKKKPGKKIKEATT